MALESGMSEAAIARRQQRRAGRVWAPEVRGALCHTLIAEICTRELTEPRSIEALAATMLPARLAPVHRQALLAFVVPMAASYVRYFSRPGW